MKFSEDVFQKISEIVLIIFGMLLAGKVMLAMLFGIKVFPIFSWIL